MSDADDVGLIAALSPPLPLFRMAETLLLPESHTFGVMVKPDDFSELSPSHTHTHVTIIAPGAGQLLHTEAPSVYLQCGRFDKGVLSSIRNKLKKEKFTNFEALLNGLQYLDKVGPLA